MDTSLTQRTDAAGLGLGAVDLRESISDRIVELISQAISEGRLKPGQRLIEANVADNFGVSRGPVREAFKTLASVGLITIRKNRGAVVTEPSPQEFEELILLRSAIEGTAARIASTTITPQDVAKLEHIIAEMSQAAEAANPFALREADWHFHEFVCELSGATSLADVWRGMQQKIRLHLHLNPQFSLNPSGVIDNHRRYLEALQSGDAGHAERTIRGLILTNGYKLLHKPLPTAFADLTTHSS